MPGNAPKLFELDNQLRTWFYNAPVVALVGFQNLEVFIGNDDDLLL